MAQMKEHEKTPDKNSHQMEISNLLDKEFKEMVIRMLSKHKELRKHFNKVRKYKNIMKS